LALPLAASEAPFALSAPFFAALSASSWWSALAVGAVAADTPKTNADAINKDGTILILFLRLGVLDEVAPAHIHFRSTVGLKPHAPKPIRGS
jgi:hypothetical protein